MTSVVLDASALMAFLHSEPDGDMVWQALSDAFISAVNYSEVLKKAIERGKEAEHVASSIRRLSLVIVPFDEQLAMTSATLYPLTKPYRMSFADGAPLPSEFSAIARCSPRSARCAKLLFPSK